MGFRERLGRALGLEPRTTIIGPRWPDTLQPRLGPYPGAVIANEPRLALALPTLYACVSMIADSVSSLPLQSFDRASRVPVDRQPTIIRKPDPFTPPGVTWRRLATSMMLYGEAFVWLTAPDANGRPTVAIPIPPDEVTITWSDGQGSLPVYEWRNRRMTPDVDLGHIKFVDIPGTLHGIGPVQALRMTIAGGVEAERYSTEFYTDGGIPTGILQHPGRLTEDEAERLRAQWTDARGAVRSTAVLQGGMEWKPVQLSNHDSQFIESRNLTAQDIARAFHVPSALINVNAAGSSLTYQNQEGIYRDYSVLAVAPVSDRLEEAWSKWIPTTQIPRFRFVDLLRADSDTRYRTYDLALRNGILSVNEVRDMENLPPIPGGDEYRNPAVSAIVDVDTTPNELESVTDE